MTPEPTPFAPYPQAPSERRALLVCASLLALGVAVLALVLSGGWRVLATSSAPAPAPPPLPAASPTPLSSAAWQGLPGQISAQTSIVAAPPSSRRGAEETRLRRLAHVHVAAGWEAGFYPLYETAGRTFGVNWLLLASIHKQETAFSTDPTTYRGLNFAGCCGGPMQFNVRNRPVSTWRRVSDSYRYAARPAAYDHPTARHPSIYDDFDAIMGAARLLASDGATGALDAGAWQAAYDYYGHDASGVDYADQVLARAIGWSQQGFCINCAVDGPTLAAVHAAWGAPTLAALPPVAPAAAPVRRKHRRRAHH